jgi:hypothetical protein
MTPPSAAEPYNDEPAPHHLHALCHVQRHQVPVDPAAVTFVRGHAVDEQEHARSDAFNEATRSPDIDLAVEEQDAWSLVHRLVHGVDGAAREIAIRHERDARDGLVEQLGALRRRDDDRHEREPAGVQHHVQAQRVTRGYGDAVHRRSVRQPLEAQHDPARRERSQAVTPRDVRDPGRPGGADPDVRDWRSGGVRYRAIDDAHHLRRPQAGRRKADEGERRPSRGARHGQGGKYVQMACRLVKSITKST